MNALLARCGLFAVAVLSVPVLLCGEEPRETEVFASGVGGYNTYRIPSVIQTKHGTLLAFCEGRKAGKGDAGDIDLVLRRSDDRGLTWSEPQVVWNDGENTCGNPCPVIDQSTGVIHLLLTWNAGNISEGKTAAGFGEDSRRVFIARSKDDGRTWSSPQDITSVTKEKNWTWYATGPGAGIQLTQGKHRGRLVVPCDHKLAAASDNNSFSHVIYSDDHGETWQLGGGTSHDKCNECEVVELSDGKLLLNMRSHDRRGAKARWISRSDDGGETWSKPEQDPALIEPICQASIRRYRLPKGDEPGWILFSNPASMSKREKLTIRASSDEGRTWPIERQLYAGGGAYSCLTVLDDGSIGCLYEKDDYRKIVFARFSFDWVRGN